MASGETVKNVTQTVTFYNVAGLIERDKQIYYVPLTDELMRQGETKICEAYKKLFDTVCPPPNSNYQNIAISRWNPEDRKLRVAGDCDTFRRGSSTTVLNYMVVKRESHYVSLSKNPIYYGFFITGVRQAGIDTVELDIEPDYWTNVFYWSNTNILTESFNPFDNVIANPFVERQHYDRVKVIERFIIDEGEDEEKPSEYETYKDYVLSGYDISNSTPQEVQSGDKSRLLIYGSFHGQNIYTDNIVLEKRKVSDYSLISSNTACGIEVDYYNETIIIYKANGIHNYGILEQITFDDYYEQNWRYVFRFTSLSGIHDTATGVETKILDLVCYRRSVSQVTDFDNMDLFVKTEEEYNYRQLFKDSRIPLNFDTYEIDTNPYVVNNIPKEAYYQTTTADALQYLLELKNAGKDKEIRAILSSCVRYLYIITKEQITYPMVLKGEDVENNVRKTYYFMGYYNKDFEVDDTFPSASQHIVIPFISETLGLEAFAKLLQPDVRSSSLGGISICGKYKNNVMYGITQYGSKAFSEYISKLNDKYGYYIQSMFVTPYSELSKCMSVAWNSPSPDVFDRPIIRFTADLVNENSTAQSPVLKRHRSGTWFTGYYYTKSEHISRTIADYDDMVVEEPTLVLLSMNRLTKDNSDLTKFAVEPTCYFQISGTITTPTGLGFNSGITQSVFDEDILGFGFLVGKKGFDSIDFLTGDKNQQVLHLKYGITEDTDLRSHFYEPILEMEPYSFYSMSMSEIETVLDRKRYYQMGMNNPSYSGYAYFERTYVVPLFYNQSVNTMYKVGIVPVYRINGISQRYYPEELMFVTTSGVTIHVDSYYEFMYVMSPQLKAQSHLAVYNAQIETKKSLVRAVASGVSGMASGSSGAGVSGVVNGVADVITTQMTNEQNIYNVTETIKAQKSSAGRKADTFSQAGSDYIYELNLDEYSVMLNHYRIDDLSYNSIAKMLERYGYFVNIYDNLNWNNRVGYNFIKLVHFDFNEANITLSEEQMSAIDEIFRNGVTLLHQRGYLETSYHNYETSLELIED